MKLKPTNNIKIAKNIRKILLIHVDKEMKNKVRSNHIVLINSMNPKELESQFLIKYDPIKTSITTFTNIGIKYIMERVVDRQKNINYYYSNDFGLEKGLIILKKNPRNFLTKYSKNNLRMNVSILLNEEEKNNGENNNNYVHLCSLFIFKKDISENKISNFETIKEDEKVKEENNLKQGNSFIQITHNKNNGNKKLKILDVNKTLINYCYSQLKKKLPAKTKKKQSNISLNNEKYREKEIEDKLGRRKTYLKNNKKNKIKREINEYKKEKEKDKEKRKISRYKSTTRINNLLKKLNNFLENNKIMNIHKVESMKKDKRKSNNYNINNMDLSSRDKNNLNKKYEKNPKSKSIVKINNKNIADYASTVDGSSQENNNLKIIKKMKSKRCSSCHVKKKEQYHTNKYYSNKNIFNINSNNNIDLLKEKVKIISKKK